MSIERFAYWLDETPVSLTLKESALMIPLTQSVHILAVAFVFSGSLLVLLRTYGLAGTAWPLSDWSNKLSGRLLIALGLLLATGSLLVIAEPTRELANPVFQIKLLLILPTVALALWLARTQAGQDDRAISLGAKVVSAIILALWVIIISAGRWIAYI